jgi:hypothetical protein
MKPSIAEVHKLSGDKENGSVENESDSPVQPFSYAKELRALGQALEGRNVTFLDLEIQGGIYVVRGKAVATKEAESSFSSFVRDLIFAVGTKSKEKVAVPDINLRFTPQQIEDLDRAGQQKRQVASKMPDPYSISQILRGAGSYLDNREQTCLVGISVKDQWVTLRYQTSEGRLEQAKQDLEYFYNYWVKMYLRRGNRPALPPPPDPSLIVTWDGIVRRTV